MRETIGWGYRLNKQKIKKNCTYLRDVFLLWLLEKCSLSPNTNYMVLITITKHEYV